MSATENMTETTTTETTAPLPTETAARDALVIGEDGRARCSWSASDPEYRRYHDEEWGTPQHDPRALYEKLCLEGFQAGLSWITILRRRPAFREVFHDFVPERVAAMTESDVQRLLGDARIIRHRGKIDATISNGQAKAAVDVPLEQRVRPCPPDGPAPPRAKK